MNQMNLKSSPVTRCHNKSKLSMNHEKGRMATSCPIHGMTPDDKPLIQQIYIPLAVFLPSSGMTYFCKYRAETPREAGNKVKSNWFFTRTTGVSILTKTWIN